VSFLGVAGHRAFAHRGWHTGDLAGLENTLPAFRRAVAEGYRYLETDVHVTADGVLVAVHDAVLDRVTDARGPVAALSYREVRRALIGGREPIPTLAEVLEACPAAFVNIDPKTDRAVGPLLDVLGQAHAWDRVCIGSFSDRRLAAIRRDGPPGLATSLGPLAAGRLVLGTGGGHGAPAVAAQLPVRWRGVPVITPRLVRRAHARGLEVHAWTVDQPAEMTRLLDAGVDGIMTDRPDVLRTVLDARGLW
jgi:glycerophosphoryl diester phosphodiesterase